MHAGEFLQDGCFYQCFGGSDVTHSLMQHISHNGFHATSQKEQDFICNIKEGLCYVSQDPEHEITVSTPHNKVYAAGSAIPLENSCFMAAEVLFKPNLLGKSNSKSS